MNTTTIQTEVVDYMAIFNKAIQEAKKQIINEEFQDKVPDSEVLGILVSKFAKWDFNVIEDVTKAALEDSNFSGYEITEAEN